MRKGLLLMQECCPSSNVEQHVHDIAIAYYVGLAFHPHRAALFGFYHAACGDQVVVMHHLGAYEAALKIGVDRACGPLSVV